MNKIYKGALKKIIIGVVLTIVVIGGFTMYASSQDNKQDQVKVGGPKEIEKVKETAEDQKKAKQADRDYERLLGEICNKSLTEATGAEFYKCKRFKTFGKLLFGFGINPSATDEAQIKLSAVCSRRIVDMKMLEFMECLEQKEENNNEPLF